MVWRGDVLEVWQAFRIARHAIPVILDSEVLLAVLAAARDGDGLRVSIDRVLDEFGDRLERITLKERDDADGVPVIADLEPTALIASRSRL